VPLLERAPQKQFLCRGAIIDNALSCKSLDSSRALSEHRRCQTKICHCQRRRHLFLAWRCFLRRRYAGVVGSDRTVPTTCGTIATSSKGSQRGTLLD